MNKLQESSNLKANILYRIKNATEDEYYDIFKGYQLNHDDAFYTVIVEIFKEEISDDFIITQLIHGVTNLPTTTDEFKSLVYSCITTESTELLDSIILFAETFDDVSAIEVLEGLKTTVKWLKSYAEEVVEHLKSIKYSS